MASFPDGKSALTGLGILEIQLAVTKISLFQLYSLSKKCGFVLQKETRSEREKNSRNGICKMIDKIMSRKARMLTCFHKQFISDSTILKVLFSYLF